MLGLLIELVIAVGAGVVWFAGLRLFLRSDLSRTRKAGWTGRAALIPTGN